AGDAEGGGQSGVFAERIETEVLDAVADALGGEGGLGFVGLGEEGDELLPADAGDEVAGAEVAGEALGGEGEGCVAALVAVAVVDLLEVVEIEQDEGEG